MTSQISWLDFSEAERRKMIEVIQLFKDQDTRDELGIGSIRDTFAELLFPGTGTLQTRARYFLIIPWLFIYYEDHNVPSGKIKDRLGYDEKHLINALKNTEKDGVIGQVSGANLHRFPSSIYWTGMRAWGIMRFSGSIDQYVQSLNYFYHHNREMRSADHDETTLESRLHNWDPGIPVRPTGFPLEADFKLNKPEAAYLRERLQLSCSNSLLAYLTREVKSLEAVDYPWMLPTLARFPQSIRSILSHAQNFSETIWGAMLLYNYLLARKAGYTNLVDQYEENIGKWKGLITSRKQALYEWDTVKFWHILHQSGRIPNGTRMFVQRWLEMVLGENKNLQITKNEAAREMIQNREFQLKRSRSRFENPRRLELWAVDRAPDS